MAKSAENGTAARKKPWWQRTWLRVSLAVTLMVAIGVGVAVEYVVRNAAPILRRRVIQTLSQRFDAPVELDSLDISVMKGLEVSGGGLRIPYGGPLDPSAPRAAHVLIRVEHFRFHSAIKSLMHDLTRIENVYVDGLVIDLPAGPMRGQIFGPNQKAVPADPSHPRTQPKISLLASHIHITHAKLVIENKVPDKEPRTFDIARVDLTDVGAQQPFAYDAELINPVPRGDIHATGHFGPWQSDAPRETALDGDYTFTHADLDTIKGLGGILSSVGHFAGVLDRLTVDGTTDTPDFSLDTSNHPVPLRTRFHAYVDGTSGDTTLDPVEARLGHSDMTCRGTIENLRGKGHNIVLDVVMPHGRVEDVLVLGAKSPKPMMRGGLALKAHLHVPPGKVRVASKLQLAGTVSLTGVAFTNQKVQAKLNALSLRAQGRLKDPKQGGNEVSDTEAPPLSPDEQQEFVARSNVQAAFTLADGQMDFSRVDYALPGALVLLKGVYLIEGDAFDFAGHIRTEAKASEMVGGWKGMLLKAVDPFLSKHGAGMELPISIRGEKNDVHFGLAFNQRDESPEQMAHDLKEQRRTARAGDPAPRASPPQN